MTLTTRGFGLLLAALVPLLLLALASTGLYTIDEAVYLAGIDAMASRGSLIVDNSYDIFGSSNQGIYFLKEAQGGLVTQYPSGYSILSAPFYAALGIRGVMLVNTLAALLALVATFALAKALFGNQRLASHAVLILAFATFFLEFSAAVWPHMQTIMLVTFALLAAVKAQEAQGRAAFGLALLSGLAIGIGVNFRADMILILPVIGAHILLTKDRPWALILGGVLGLLPGIAAASALNWLKFGTLNPISYGVSGGGVDPRSHLPVIMAVALALLAVLFRRQVLARVDGRLIAVILAAGVVGLVYFVPEAARFARRLLSGVHHLMIDLTALPENNQTRPGVVYREDGTIAFWGFWKKALLQSLPWLAAVPALMLYRWGNHEGRGLLLIALAFLLYPLPYVYASWHGGLGSNMRYFAVLLPLAAISGAWAWQRLGGQEARLRREGAAAIFFFAAAVAVVLPQGLGFAWVHQKLPVFLAALVFAMALATRLSPSPSSIVQSVARTAFMAALLLAALLGPILDVFGAQQRRAAISVSGAALAALPGPSVIYGMGEIAIANMGQEDHIFASQDFNGFIDTGFLAEAAAAGYRIYALQPIAQEIAQKLDTFDIRGGVIPGSPVPHVELVAVGPTDD